MNGLDDHLTAGYVLFLVCSPRSMYGFYISRGKSGNFWGRSWRPGSIAVAGSLAGAGWGALYAAAISSSRYILRFLYLFAGIKKAVYL